MFILVDIMELYLAQEISFVVGLDKFETVQQH